MSENENNGSALPVETSGSSWKTILSLVLVVLLLGSIYVTTTPEFAVLQAHYAVKSKSVGTFERAVDVDKVARNLVIDMVSTPISSLLGEYHLMPEPLPQTSLLVLYLVYSCRPHIAYGFRTHN